MNAPKNPTSDHTLTPTSSGGFYGVLFLVLISAVGAFVWGWLPKVQKQQSAVADTRDLAIVRVRAAAPVPAPLPPPLSLPGELKARVEASITARATGYVSKWHADLGDKVESGQLLLELDTPEMERDIAKSQAQLEVAEAGRKLAETTAARWKEMLAVNATAPQAADEKQADLELKTAAVAAARADLERLEQLKNFAKLSAPFAGTITARRVEQGQLVEANVATELFHLADTSKLRVFIHVPQAFAQSIQVGQDAQLVVAEYRGSTFPAKVTRTAGAIDAASRTLLTELEVDNKAGKLLAGSYTQVLLPTAKMDAPLTVPANALIFRSNGAQLALIEENSGLIKFVKVTLGRDFGATVEISEGVTSESRVVLNPPDSLTEGMHVEVVQ